MDAKKHMPHKPSAKTNLTSFQWKVLKATLKIPMGETRTYQQIARAVGKPGAARAVGTALKKNPLAPLIPCHRVIRSDGTVGKYGGKDDPRKERLLAMERTMTEK